MAALIDAIDVKRKSVFEIENVPYACLDVEVSTPTARGGQTLVRIKMRNLINNAVFDKTFKASEKFKEPDLVLVPATYLYSDNDGSYFLDQESYETLNLTTAMLGDALDFLIDGDAGAVAQVQRQPHRPTAPHLRRVEHRPHRACRARRHLQRQRHQGRAP